MNERVPPDVPIDAPTLQAPADAFETYVVPEIAVLYRAARALTRHPHDAEDLVQDTLLRAHRSIHTFDGRHPRAWLLTILRNAHLSRVRRPRPELLHDADGVERRQDPAPDATDALIDTGFDAELVRALDDLPAMFRDVIDLVDIGGQPYATAAETLGVPIGTVMSRLHRARTRLRKQLLRAGVAPRSSR